MSKKSVMIGRYEVRSRLGQGGDGVVYSASDPVLQREVAIKIPRKKDDDPDHVAEVGKAFYHEAIIGSHFHHQNIVTIFDVGRDKNIDFLVMEKVPGISLKRYIETQQNLEIIQAVELIYRVCLALDYMHYYDILHRDIKPSNIIVNSKLNIVKVMDFSAATKKYDINDPQAGSFHYMAPECHQSNKILDERIDIFSTGVSFYEILCNQKPFNGNDSMAIIFNVLNEPPQKLSDIIDIPVYVEEIVEKAMHKDPNLRYQSALVMADALMGALEKLKHEVNAAQFDEDQQYLILRKDVWFKNFSPAQVKELMEAGSVEIYNKKQVIISEGEKNNAFYILLKGKVNIDKKKQNICTLTEGECFGEISYLTSAAASATVTAESTVMLWQVTPSLLENASCESQLGFYKAFNEVLIKRLVSGTKNIAELQETLIGVVSAVGAD